jgi:hypothetical protein
MADPFSVTGMQQRDSSPHFSCTANYFFHPGTAVGIVSLGIQVCNGIVKYYAQWKDYDDDIKATLNQIKELQALFQTCRAAIEDLEPVPEELLIVLENQLQACKAAILRHQKYLKKLSAQLPDNTLSPRDVALAYVDYRRKQLLYPFRQGTLGKLRDCVFEARNNLVPALQALNLYVMRTQKKPLYI